MDIPYIATPGEKHVPEVFIKPLRPKSVNANTIVINEVRNDTSRANVDWVEPEKRQQPDNQPQGLGTEHRNGHRG